MPIGIQTRPWEGEGGTWETIAESHTDMYTAEVQHFAHCVLQDEQPLISGIASKRALQVAMAALHALESGQPQLV